jgi:DNA helicase-2/ATP-dependent DNA helicase PcrA
MYNAVNITGKNEEGEHSYKHTNNLKNFFTIYDKVDTDIEEGLLNILEYISLASRDNEELIRRRNSIPILTIHQSKGLEYDFIFFAGVQENCIPNYYSKNNSEEFDEEKRVFYVAITRAKEKLFISAPKMNLFNKPVNYSSFIDFIPSKYLI